jgi:hypothetical protein
VLFVATGVVFIIPFIFLRCTWSDILMYVFVLLE